MAYIRLNAKMKQAIIRAAIHHGFTDRKQKLDAEEDEIGRAIWSANVTPEQAAMAEELGESWVNFTNEIKVAHLGRVYYFKLKDGAKLPCPNYNAHQWAPKDPALQKRVQEHLDNDLKFREEKDKARLHLETLLNSVATLKRLEEVWPEGKQFFPEFKKVNVPAVPVGQLNAMLGLA